MRTAFSKAVFMLSGSVVDAISAVEDGAVDPEQHCSITATTITHSYFQGVEFRINYTIIACVHKYYEIGPLNIYLPRCGHPRFRSD